MTNKIIKFKHYLPILLLLTLITACQKVQATIEEDTTEGDIRIVRLKMCGPAHSQKAQLLGNIANQGWTLIEVDGGSYYFKRASKDSK